MSHTFFELIEEAGEDGEDSLGQDDAVLDTSSGFVVLLVADGDGVVGSLFLLVHFLETLDDEVETEVGVTRHHFGEAL